MLLIWAKYPIRGAVSLKISYPKVRMEKSLQPKGILRMFPFEKGITYKIELKYRKGANEKGIIWIYPSTREIKVDIYQTYEFNYNIRENLGNRLEKYQLTYSINSVDKDTKLKFKYNENFTYEDDKIATNPLKICHKGECDYNITTYDIKKGESYKIYIIINAYKKMLIGNETFINVYYLPSYSFSFNDKEELKIEEKKEAGAKVLNLNNLTKTKIAGIIIISILLIAGIGFGVYLIYRKKFKSNLEKHIKLELETLNENNEINLSGV